MDKELEALERLTTFMGVSTEEQAQAICKDIDLIEKALKDFEWLKSVFSIDMYEQLPTAEDKIRFLEIMGVKYE